MPEVLQEAHTFIDEHLARLRELADRTRQACDLQGAEMRAFERQLDEALIQHRSAVQRQAAQSTQLAERVAALRATYTERTGMLNEQRAALKQLEQLIRQTEMSSDALNATEQSAADPWVLALRAQVIHGREEERMRLAREVHDGPAQVLANSLMLMESAYTLAQKAEQEKLIQVLDRLRQATREGLHEVRRFIANLRAVDVQSRGLVAAVQEYIETYNRAYQSAVDVQADPIPRLPGDVEIVLYRIMQEALQNVHKYARGAAVRVRLLRQPGSVVLSVRDDGPGFDPHEVVRRAGTSNWGLTSMRERAELVGARLTVASQPGHGTEVTVYVPLE